MYYSWSFTLLIVICFVNHLSSPVRISPLKAGIFNYFVHYYIPSFNNDWYTVNNKYLLACLTLILMLKF